MIMNEIQYNPALSTLSPSATLAINQTVQAKRATDHDIVHFGFGESPFKVPRLIVDALIKHAVHKNYLPGEGLSPLREAVSQYYQNHYQYKYKKEDVFIFPGSKAALFHLLYLLDGPLLLPSPSWVSYAPQARLLDKKISIIQTTFDRHYEPTDEALIQACLQYPKTQQKILLLNSPNNPTGLCLTSSRLDSIASIAEEYNIIILSDEIYAGIYFNHQSHSSMAYHAPHRTIVTSGLSKLFSAGGYRLGLCLIPDTMPHLKSALTTMISETFSCVSSPIQYAAHAAYSEFNHITPYLEQCKNIHQLVGFYLHTQFEELGLLCHKPQGAFYLFPSFIHHKEKLSKLGIKTDKDLCQRLLIHYNLAVLPGSDFLMPADALTVRVATVDYEGDKALQADDINAPCFKHIHKGIKILSEFLL